MPNPEVGKELLASPSRAALVRRGKSNRTDSERYKKPCQGLRSIVEMSVGRKAHSASLKALLYKSPTAFCCNTTVRTQPPVLSRSDPTETKRSSPGQVACYSLPSLQIRWT